MKKITTPNWDKESWISSKSYIDYCVQVLSDSLSINPESKLLDIGCGRANISAALAEFNDLILPIEAVDLAFTGAEKQPKNRVDFYCCDAVEYLSGKPGDIYNGIIVKQVFHLFPADKKQVLLSQIYRCLKKGGRALILQMPAVSRVPMFSRVRQIFDRERLMREEVVTLASHIGLKTEVTNFSFQVSMAKRDYFDLLRQRFMSVLREFSDSEIETGIAELDKIYPQDNLIFSDDLDVIHLICP